MTRFDFPRLGGLMLVLVVGATLLADAVQAQYPWPLQPFNASQRITGTFLEYRGPSNPHFHNGVDIPQADGTPVYAVASGTVTSLDPNGSNAFVRVGRFAYVHIRPAPNLSVGDPVTAGVTVLGTILPGQGHVHFKDGYSGSEIQPLREGGGLTPFTDPWPPVISDIRFYLQPTRQRLSAGSLTGPVEITFRVEEVNANANTSSAGRNNGAYFVGYKVLSRDRQTEVYVPGNGGITFQFDSILSNTFVHNVFDRLQSSTSRHVYLVASTLTQRTAWDTSLLPDGDYTLALFAGDTRDNVTTTYVDVSVTQRDLVGPPQPTLLHAVFDQNQARFGWTGGEADDLRGYRLLASPDNLTWTPEADENVLAASSRSHLLPTAPATTTYYHLVAADTVTQANVSIQSDIYGIAPSSDHRILVVDGFDRATGSGSWQTPWHRFAFHHGRAIAANGYGFETAANESVADGTVSLDDYDAVVWLLGDESTTDETFSNTEQSRVRAYLEGGGNLFVSGSEIAWDLEARGSTSDQTFLRTYLKAQYAGDDAGSLVAQGVAGSVFDGITLTYGSSPYEEDYPDYFTPASGGTAALRYSNQRIAGIQYEGTFGASTAPGKLVLLGFPFETITSEAIQASVMGRVLTFFFETATSAETEAVPSALVLHPHYPNPVTDRATFAFTMPAAGHATLSVYDALGRRIATVVDAVHATGTHRVGWQPGALASGLYLYRLDTPSGSRTGYLLRTR